ncbi:hypothetical protein JS531_07320 [Bifidobacterium sp. CP2]|uniref:hypothetical protein n=1 Tax=Bifidobacterium TaxID=1678 RepID=UPI001BDCA14C|nr:MULTISPECIES: hypothetical protein [Bifidobacterium]MBT1181766.1 hypothetical protein [Bifidobacterium sp. CP2]MBW3081765.1 hypothetical protein [Bifidobacterium saguinibicoloris]
MTYLSPQNLEALITRCHMTPEDISQVMGLPVDQVRKAIDRHGSLSNDARGRHSRHE